MRDKEDKIMEEKHIFDEIKEWKKSSERGEVCGIFGCEDKPVVQCHRCGNWYCKEHIFVHFHEGLP